MPAAFLDLPDLRFMRRFFRPRPVCVCLALFAAPYILPQAKPPTAIAAPAGAETLSYGIEWRLIYAGSARMSFTKQKSEPVPEWESKLHLESGGLVSRLYKLEDNYRVEMQDQFCATSSQFDAIEGSRRHQTNVTFDRSSHKATYLEKDMVKGSVIKSAETDIPACVSDIIGGLYKLRTMHLQPGQSAQVPISDGKKSVSARVEALDKEEIVTKAGKFNAIRYEVFVFNGVLYKKNAKLEVWMSDDNRKLPVQFRARMPFPIGTITFQLEKEEHT
jgi:hypothetical protein